jgi:PAS domain S-box-containing protein
MPSDDGNCRDPLRDKIIGLGERSFRKSYYPELQRRLADLERFRALLDESNDAIFMIDATDGRLLDVNGAACRYLGRDRETLLQMTAYDLIDRNTVDRIVRLFMGQGECLNITVDLRGADGRTIPFEFTIKIVSLNGVSHAVAVGRDIAERRANEEQIKASLHEKEVMLKEIHHRVKNNLQVISSLLSIQSTTLADPRDAKHFQESRDRIRTMALVHEKLYQSDDIAVVDFGPYVERLTAQLFRSYTGSGGRVSLYVDVRDIGLGPDQAVPCGLIINELVTNALKYAFRDGRNGTITVSMRQESDYNELVVSDDGVGMPADFNLEETESLGLQLVNMLTNQLEGTVIMNVSHGTKFTIRFRRSLDNS